MWDSWNLKDKQHRHTLDDPKLYAFADISQNNHNVDQKHWDLLQWVLNYTSRDPRPLNQVKIYGSNGSPYGNDDDALERFWRGIIGGSAAVRFHRPTSGIGLNDLAQATLRSARLLMTEFDIFRATPDGASKLLLERDPDEAYITAVPGEQYAIYFTNGGSVKLNLKNVTGPFEMKFLDIKTSQWQATSALDGDAVVTIKTPKPGHWVALLVKSRSPNKPAGL